MVDTIGKPPRPMNDSALARQVRDLIAERDCLRACIERIDSINDNPAIFNTEIAEAIQRAVDGQRQSEFRSVLSWEKKDA